MTDYYFTQEEREILEDLENLDLTGHESMYTLILNKETEDLSKLREVL